MNETQTRADQLFHQALLIREAAQRAEFLDKACKGDAWLRDALDRRLAAEQTKAVTFDPDSATIDSGSPTGPVRLTMLDEGPGTQIGPYKLMQVLGEGGMGTVYLAEQSVPVKRKVALKIIKPGMDSKMVVTRFQAERQALAMMDHPSIARVLDGGATETCRPYFVMELVKGIPITKYCDQEHLTPRQRLELFIPVCEAVQHAHQKGIIHRDLKPGNVLVALYDGKAVPKVIDFGVAKATTSSLTDGTMFTQVGQMIGTLEYMSPEQAEFSNLDIDTRADVYSLGVILYELLTGSRPISGKALMEGGYEKMLRIIREHEPDKPSTRLAQSETLATLAASRKVEPTRLTRQLQGEPDWIVMKCLEKERTRRYETANALGLDIQRYLNDEPVLAGPPSRLYKFKKYAKKYRGPLAAACAFALLLVAATVLSVMLAAWARSAESEARALAQLEKKSSEEAKQSAAMEKVAREEAQRLAESEKQARESAQQSERDTKDVLAFFEEKVLAAGRPKGQEGGLGRDVTVRAAVDAAEPQIAQSFADRPLVEASIRRVLGKTYYYLGEAQGALEQFQEALRINRQQLGPDHEDTLKSMSNLASGYDALGNKVEALKLREESLRLQEAKLGADHPTTLRSMMNLGNSYDAAGRDEEAMRLRERELELREAKFGKDDPDTLRARMNLANIYFQLKRKEEALVLAKSAYERQETTLGVDHPDTLQSLNNLAYMYGAVGRHGEALPLQERAFRLMVEKLGPDHPVTLKTMNNLAECFRALGRVPEAQALQEDALRRAREKLGGDHLDTIEILISLAETYNFLDRRGDALKLLQEAVGPCEQRYGADHPKTTQLRAMIAASSGAGREM